MEMKLPGRDRLRQWVERTKMSQLECAELIGIDPTQLSQILTGKRRPGLDNAVKIEQATGIVVEAWVPFDDDEPAEPQPQTGQKAATGKA